MEVPVVPGHWITALLTRYGCTYTTHIQIFQGALVQMYRGTYQVPGQNYKLVGTKSLDLDVSETCIFLRINRYSPCFQYCTIFRYTASTVGTSVDPLTIPVPGYRMHAYDQSIKKQISVRLEHRSNHDRF